MHRNPKDLRDTDDIVNLIYSEEDDVLENLQLRHQKKKIYTAISHILLAVNPYQRHPIYGKDVIKKYYDAMENVKRMPPHVYNLSCRAYQALLYYDENQSLIVSGESGAGKTENAKRLMECLTAQSSLNKKVSSSSRTTLEEKILECNPILEAMGNAKTKMNNNSSRFGKFTKILFKKLGDKQYKVCGAKIESYLLEKSRVIIQESEERNYHFFYFLFLQNQLEKIMDRKYFNKLKLDGTTPKDYYYLFGNGSGAIQATTVLNRDEESMLNEMQNAFGKLNFSKEECSQIYCAVASVLHFGQISFEESPNGGAQITKKSSYRTKIVSDLLGLNEENVKKRLVTKTLRVGFQEIAADLNLDDAVANLDVLSKVIYHRLFLYLVARMTKQLYVEEMGVNDRYIGILDVFGFEYFEENSFEQLCINYCNEQLQQYFNKSVIASEQHEYLQEGLKWEALEVADNAAMVQLVSGKKNGLFALTDSACTMPKASSDILHHSIVQSIVVRRRDSAHSDPLPCRDRNKLEKKKKRNSKGFVVSHYAADVDYSVDLFLNKNNDTVHADTVKLLLQSKHQIIVDMMEKDAKKMKKRKKSFQGVGTGFNKKLNVLMADLDATRGWFLRCLNPNKVKSATEWNEAHMRNQLKCNGIIEAIKVTKLGYPTRAEHGYVVNKFKDSFKSIGNFEKFSLRQKMKCIMMGMNVDEKEYELGFSKIFFRPNQTRFILEEIQSHNGKFNEKKIAQIKSWLSMCRLPACIGILKAYYRMYRGVLMPRIVEATRKIIAVALTTAKFQRVCDGKIRLSKERMPVPVEQEVEEEVVKEPAEESSDWPSKVSESSEWEHTKTVEEEEKAQTVKESTSISSGSIDYESSSGYEESSGYSESTDSFTKTVVKPESVEEEKEDSAVKRGKELLRGKKLEKLKHLARKWGVGSVIGEGFTIYDDHDEQCYKDLLIQINLFGDEICWEIMDEGVMLMEIKDIIELESKVAKKRFKRTHPEINTDLCFNVKTKERKLTFLCNSRGQRNAWFVGLKLLRATDDIARQFKDLRQYFLQKRLKFIGEHKEESWSTSETSNYREHEQRWKHRKKEKKSKICMNEPLKSCMYPNVSNDDDKNEARTEPASGRITKSITSFFQSSQDHDDDITDASEIENEEFASESRRRESRLLFAKTLKKDVP